MNKQCSPCRLINVSRHYHWPVMRLVIIYFHGQEDSPADLCCHPMPCTLPCEKWKIVSDFICVSLSLSSSVSRCRFNWRCWITSPFFLPLHSVNWMSWNTCVMGPVKCVTTWAHTVQSSGSWANTWLNTHFLSAGVPVWQDYSLLQTMLIKILCRYVSRVIMFDILYIEDLI